MFKEVGKISQLEKLVGDFSSPCAIGHTRWATHGKVSRENSHPHLDENNSVAVVLNGIIENFQALRDSLKAEGVVFRSETDAEVLPHLIAKMYEGDLLRAVQQALLLVHGSFAIAVLHKNHPDLLIAAANGAPLVVGVGVQEMFVAS
ncbi:MAG TPA: glutamine--fructose-6-phosphate aminotransferase, partial [Anaerolineales bacterium]|nr:glutamine--fructose-6-phosphate aminotransferase [Anaerolineales bacterium]